MQPFNYDIESIITTALHEDIGKGDVTSDLTIDSNKEVKFKIIAREAVVVCGVFVVQQVFSRLDPDIKINLLITDGKKVKKNTIILSGQGKAKAILAAERTALNLMSHMCAVASLTAEFVAKVKNTKTRILDTRKTLPGLRAVQKYAVQIGGGYNHRFCLDDGILIKDNHISICGGIKKAVIRAKKNAPALHRIEIECDTIKQVKEAIAAKADIVLLDNMSIADLKKAVYMAAGKVLLEASGGVNLDNVYAIAQTGVDFISIGALTHSAKNKDLSLEIS